MSNSVTILLVDDDYLLAKGTAKLIERLGGYKVKIADEPGIIWQQCQSGDIDLVLMDVNLPGACWQGEQISGADLARYLKSHPQTARIPIILMTAYAMLNEKQALLAISGADEFCAKPIADYQALLELIAQLHPKEEGSRGGREQGR